MLRTGADEGRVSGVFEIKGTETLKQIEKLTDVARLQMAGRFFSPASFIPAGGVRYR